jgi:hypothetical protein
MKPRLLLLLLNLAVFAAWAGKFVSDSWPDGHFM